ncbi:hypothetical protein QQP08_025454 [Theobroma cacao]|nr:hypothetical protein QQP08_025454 [Theobroma cacao]
MDCIFSPLGNCQIGGFDPVVIESSGLERGLRNAMAHGVFLRLDNCPLWACNKRTIIDLVVAESHSLMLDLVDKKWSWNFSTSHYFLRDGWWVCTNFF